MIARVFPRRTTATPDDDYAFVGEPPLFMPNDITEVHISVTFTWDLPAAERLVRAWERVAPVKIGGPATGMRGEEFTPGMYLKLGYVITSRGCPNDCWFCFVPEREGYLRELTVEVGNNVLDDNLLACSDNHIRKVILMLEIAPQPRLLTGGLEALRFLPWHARALVSAGITRVYFAYDTPDDLYPLRVAGKIAMAEGLHPLGQLCAYVLVAYPKDTIEAAQERCLDAARAGFMPYAMPYRGKDGKKAAGWSRFARTWSRPAATRAELKRLGVINRGKV